MLATRFCCSACLAAGAGVLLSLGWLGLTYRSWADGEASRYAPGLACAATAALALGAWSSLRAPSPWLVPLLAMLPLLPGLAIHAARLAARPVPLAITLDTPGSEGGATAPVLHAGLGAWRLHAGQERGGGTIVPVLRGGATLTTVAGTVQLRVPPGSLGYLEVHLPHLGARAWYLPRALLDPASALVVESVTWSMRVEREGAYLGLAWIDRIDLQLTDAGVLVTHPTPDGDTIASRLEAQPPLDDWATWTLERARGTRSLLLAGDVVWRTRDGGPFETIRIGETRPDAGHGGVIWVRALRYERRLGAAGSLGAPEGAL